MDKGLSMLPGGASILVLGFGSPPVSGAEDRSVEPDDLQGFAWDLPFSPSPQKNSLLPANPFMPHV